MWSKLLEIRGFLTKKEKKKKKKKKGFLNHFWQSVEAILENVSVAETIVQC